MRIPETNISLLLQIRARMFAAVQVGRKLADNSLK